MYLPDILKSKCPVIVTLLDTYYREKKNWGKKSTLPAAPRAFFHELDRHRCRWVAPESLYIMYLHFWRCVYMYTCTHIYVYMYTCTHIHMYTYIHMHMYIYTYIMYTCTHIYMYICALYIAAPQPRYIMHMYMYEHMYTCIHVYIYIYICSYIFFIIIPQTELALWGSGPFRLVVRFSLRA